MDGTTAVVGDDGIVASAAVENARSRRKEWVARLENRDANTAVTGASGRATYQSHFQQLDQTFPKVYRLGLSGHGFAAQAALRRA
jgi:hypothetical protein